MTVSSKEPSEERRVTLPRDPGAARRARAAVEKLLRARSLPDAAVENAMLVSSELAANAYQHGSGAIELRLVLNDDWLRIEVIDEGRDQAPAVREQPADESGGWGLRIVDQVALQWGVFEGTTHVWADIALR